MVAAARPTNPWSEPHSARVAPASRGGHYGYGQAYDSGQAALQDRVAPGQYLNPGAVGYSARNNAGNYARQGYRPRGFHRYNPYFYTGLYYPYFYGGYFPGYYGSFDGGFGDGLGVDGNLTTGTANGSITAESSADSSGAYREQNNTAPEARSAMDDPALPPDQPANVGPENPLATEQRAPVSNGPDSLVEAVQGELAKRGYFAGKVDSMYGDSTREALRRFQADQRLGATGRINEATLHALQLD